MLVFDQVMQKVTPYLTNIRVFCKSNSLNHF